MGVHVLLIPWVAQGQLTPLIQLASTLASLDDFLITIVLPARGWARLQAASSPLPQQPNIQIQVIDDALNPDLSQTPSYEQMVASLPILQHHLETLLQAFMASSSPVTCVIATSYSFWSLQVAQKLNIPRAEMWSSPAYMYCCGFFYERLLSAGLVPFRGRAEDTWITCIPGLPPIRASDYIQEQLLREEDLQADPEKLSRTRFHLNETFLNARDRLRILVNSIYDLESEPFDVLKAENVRACAIGPLFLHNLDTDDADQPLRRTRTSMYKEDHTCLQWLDGKAPSSTVYVAFGSDSTMEKQDLQELAYGLEASGHSFLWVIRPGSVQGDLSMDDVLPKGYKERVGERGLVVSWVQQTDVLAHRAIGGFLSHCGWNSTLEALWAGIPILAWPQRVDQPVNKKFIVDEWRVGVAIEKSEEGKVTRFTIEKGIRYLMQGEERFCIRETAKKVKELMWKATRDGGLSRTNLDEFIQDLRSLSTEQSGKSS